MKIFIYISLYIILSACGGSGEGSNQELTEREKFDINVDKWLESGIVNYQFDLKIEPLSTNFSTDNARLNVRLFTVVVENSLVQKIFDVRQGIIIFDRESSSNLIDICCFDSSQDILGNSIIDWFSTIEAFIDNSFFGNSNVEVNYDDQYGYPKEIILTRQVVSSVSDENNNGIIDDDEMNIPESEDIITFFEISNLQ